MEIRLPFSIHKSVSQGANQRVFDPGNPLCRPHDDPYITRPVKMVHLRHHATSDCIKGVLNFPPVENSSGEPNLKRESCGYLKILYYLC